MMSVREATHSVCSLCMLILVCVALLWVSQSPAASEPAYESAAAAADAGRFAEMQSIYEQMLVREPQNMRALTGKAAALAWQQKYKQAQEAYRYALRLEPRNTDARVGLAYALAWDGQYMKAHDEFNHVLNLNPTHAGARKGIGLTYWWEGEHNLALDSLDLASTIDPDDAELWEVAGHVHLQQRNNRTAIASYDRALQLEPNRDSAKVARMAAFRTAPQLEFLVQAGSTSDAGSGLRRLEIAHWPGRSTRFAFRYDNTLALDNVSIQNRGEDADGYFASLGHHFSSGLGISVEGGRLDLADGSLTVGALQGAFNVGAASLRLGFQIGDHETGYSDKLTFAGVNFPLRDKWRLEPVIYVAETGRDADREWRAVMNVEHRLNHQFSVGGQLGAGRVEAAVDEFNGNTSIAGSWLRWETNGPYALTLGARQEWTPTRDFSVVELTVAYRLPSDEGGLKWP